MKKTFRLSLPDGAHCDAHAGENLLAAAQRAHWLVRYGCRNGNCDACAATLLIGCVRQRDDQIIEAPAAKILLCRCQPLSDLQIALPNDPRPGSMDQSLRCYARLQHQNSCADESVLSFVLPAGKKPALRAEQIALIETDAGLLQGRIDPTQSQGRALSVKLPFASSLQEGAYYHVRYPLNTADLRSTAHKLEDRDD